MSGNVTVTNGYASKLVWVVQPEDLLRMEGLLLQSLDFRINAPTAYTFLSLLKQHIGVSPRVAALAVYLLVCAALPLARSASHPYWRG